MTGPSERARLLELIERPMRPAISALVEVVDAEPRWLEASSEAHRLSRADPSRESELWTWVENELFEACCRQDEFAMRGISPSRFATSAILTLGFMSFAKA